jgi:hypothetical protein
MQDRIKEIRDRVAKATVAPWGRNEFMTKYITRTVNNGTFICTIESNDDDAEY